MFDSVKTAAAELLEGGLGLVYPNVCQLCRNESASLAGGYVGEECRKKIQIVEPPFCSHCGVPVEGSVSAEFVCETCRLADFNFICARGAARVGPTLLEVVHRYKYQHSLYFEPYLEELLVSHAGPSISAQCDLIAPVPLHPVKQREREFNQAERLASCLSRATGIPMNSNIVRRVIPTTSQTTLDRAQRAANVRNAFVPAANGKLNGQRVVLIDDIITTCATTNACAGALLKAGAGSVRVWAVARGV
jgi:ComF family protein